MSRPQTNKQTAQLALSTYVSASEVRSTYHVAHSTLRGWAKRGKIKCVTSPGGKRFYDIDSVRAAFGESVLSGSAPPAPPRERIAYARVSSAAQKPDLQRQIDDLRRAKPDRTTVSDV